MPITSDISTNDSNVTQSLNQFFKEKVASYQATKKYHKDFVSRKIPARITNAYQPILSKILTNENLYRDNFSSRLKCINLADGEDPGVSFKKNREGFIDVFIKEDNIAPTRIIRSGDSEDLDRSIDDDNLQVDCRGNNDNTIIRPESDPEEDDEMQVQDDDMQVDNDDFIDPAPPTPITQNLEMTLNNTSIIANQITQNLHQLQSEFNPDLQSTFLPPVAEECDMETDQPDQNNFLITGEERQQHAEKNFQAIDNLANELCQMDQSRVKLPFDEENEFDEFDNINFSQKSVQMNIGQRIGSQGINVGQIRYDQLLKAKSFKPTQVGNNVSQRSTFMNEDVELKKNKKGQNMVKIGIDFDETVPLALLGINLSETMRSKSSRSTNYSFSSHQIRKQIKESKLRIIKDPDFDAVAWENSLYRLENFPEIMIGRSSYRSGSVSGYESDDVSRASFSGAATPYSVNSNDQGSLANLNAMSEQHTKVLSQVDHILTQMNENDDPAEPDFNISHLEETEIEDIYNEIPEARLSQIMHSPTKSQGDPQFDEASEKANLKKLLQTPKTAFSMKNLARQKMLMNDIKNVDVAEVKTVMKNLINDEKIMPRRRRKSSGVKKSTGQTKEKTKPKSINNKDVNIDIGNNDHARNLVNYKTSNRLEVRKFSDLITKTPKSRSLRKTAKNDLSVPIMFNLLLHLANEQKLHIRSIDGGFNDLDIISPLDGDVEVS